MQNKVKKKTKLKDFYSDKVRRKLFKQNQFHSAMPKPPTLQSVRNEDAPEQPIFLAL